MHRAGKTVQAQKSLQHPVFIPLNIFLLLRILVYMIDFDSRF